MKLYPEVAGRDCRDCRAWQYNDIEKVGGRITLRAGKPVARPAGQPPPCRRCPKIPLGVTPAWWHAVEWSAKNRQAFRFHQECKAVGAFPNDPIVRRNAGLIETTLADIRDGRAAFTAELLGAFLGLGGRV